MSFELQRKQPGFKVKCVTNDFAFITFCGPRSIVSPAHLNNCPNIDVDWSLPLCTCLSLSSFLGNNLTQFVFVVNPMFILMLIAFIVCLFFF